jgi:hypothetical protein
MIVSEETIYHRDCKNISVIFLRKLGKEQMGQMLKQEQFLKLEHSF